MSKQTHTFTRNLVFMALLCAISMLLSRVLAINTPIMRISLGSVPIVLAGLCLGPAAGAMVGLVADFMGCVFLSTFGYTPILALSPMLMGALPWLLGRYFFRGDRVSLARVYGVLLPAELLGPVCWTTFGLHLLYGTPLAGLLASRIPVLAVTGLLDGLVIYLLLKSGLFRRLGLWSPAESQAAN